MSDLHPAQLLVIAVVAAVLLRWNLWRAVLFLAPGSVVLDADEPSGAPALPSSLMGQHEALVALGFAALGTHLEHPRFGRAVLSWDYAHPTERVFASLYESQAWRPKLAQLTLASDVPAAPPPEVERARLYLLTPTRGGGLVLTASFPRPAREVKGRYLSGSIEGAAPERLLKAHQRRVAEQGEPESAWTLEGRVDAARKWYLDVGKTEVRQQNAVGLLWTLGALGMVGAAFAARNS